METFSFLCWIHQSDQRDRLDGWLSMASDQMNSSTKQTIDTQNTPHENKCIGRNECASVSIGFWGLSVCAQSLRSPDTTKKCPHIGTRLPYTDPHYGFHSIPFFDGPHNRIQSRANTSHIMLPSSFA